jgi:hypothetical protein
MHSVGRNERCPCGSGRKYKVCCLPGDEAAPDAMALHAMDRRLVAAMMAFAERLPPDVFAAALDSCPVVPDGNGPMPMIVVPWTVFHADLGGDTLAERFVAHARDLSSDERGWIAAQLAARLTIWQVVAVTPGETLTLRDLLGEATRVVIERAASTQLVVHDALCARVVDFAGISLLASMHPRLLGPRESAAVVEEVRAHARRGRCDLTRLTGSGAREVLAAWDTAVSELDRRPPPILHNTDGDKLKMTTDHFTFARGSRPAIEASLQGLRGIERDDAEEGDAQSEQTTFVALRDGNRMHGSWDNTVVGRVLVSEGELRIETNSTKRANALRSRIERACGDRIARRSRETHDLDGMREAARRDPSSEAASAIVPADAPEVQDIMRDMMRRHYESWIDQPVPALGGKTPRQAARSAKHRAALDLLLREIEHHDARRPAAERVDLSWLRTAVGLSTSVPGCG